MKIELKDIKISERKSEESFAFDANLFINDYKAGMAYNHGAGGETIYNGTDVKGKKLIKRAEEWCKKQPPFVFSYEEEIKEFPMTLENYINRIVEDHYNKQVLVRFQNKIEQEMKTELYLVCQVNTLVFSLLPIPLKKSFSSKAERNI